MKNKKASIIVQDFAQKDVELHLEREAVKSTRSLRAEVYHFRPVAKGYSHQQFI